MEYLTSSIVLEWGQNILIWYLLNVLSWRTSNLESTFRHGFFSFAADPSNWFLLLDNAQSAEPLLILVRFQLVRIHHVFQLWRLNSIWRGITMRTYTDTMLTLISCLPLSNILLGILRSYWNILNCTVTLFDSHFFGSEFRPIKHFIWDFVILQ
jgi:hypothetical protein